MDEELKKKMDKIYDKHTKRDDGRCPGCHESDSDYVLERDFIDEICGEEDEI